VFFLFFVSCSAALLVAGAHFGAVGSQHLKYCAFGSCSGAALEGSLQDPHQQARSQGKCLSSVALETPSSDGIKALLSSTFLFEPMIGLVLIVVCDGRVPRACSVWLLESIC